MQKSLIAAATLATLAALPAEARRGGGGYSEGMLFIAETTEVDDKGAPLSLCILEKTNKIMFFPIYRSAQSYALAPNRCDAENYYGITADKFQMGQVLGIFPEDLPIEPKLSMQQMAGGMWGLALGLPLILLGIAGKIGGRAPKPKLDSFADKVVSVMCYVARADGKIETAEVNAMCNVLHQLTGKNYDPQQVGQYAMSLSGEMTDRELKKLAKGLDQDHKNVLVQAAIMIAGADGLMDGTENQIIYRLSKAMKVGGEKVDEMLDRTMNTTAMPAE